MNTRTHAHTHAHTPVQLMASIALDSIEESNALITMAPDQQAHVLVERCP